MEGGGKDAGEGDVRREEEGRGKVKE